MLQHNRPVEELQTTPRRPMQLNWVNNQIKLCTFVSSAEHFHLRNLIKLRRFRKQWLHWAHWIKRCTGNRLGVAQWALSKHARRETDVMSLIPARVNSVWPMFTFSINRSCCNCRWSLRVWRCFSSLFRVQQVQESKLCFSPAFCFVSLPIIMTRAAFAVIKSLEASLHPEKRLIIASNQQSALRNKPENIFFHFQALTGR